MNEDIHELKPNELGDFVKFQGIKAGEIPQKTFFYELVEHENYRGFIDAPDERKIIAVSENEAAGLSETKWRQVGVGDGRAYIASLRNCGIKPGQSIPVEKSKQIMKEAFNAELEVARGHYQRPTKQTYFFMGASKGTQGAEELANRRN